MPQETQTIVLPVAACGPVLGGCCSSPLYSSARVGTPAPAPPVAAGVLLEPELVLLLPPLLPEPPHPATTRQKAAQMDARDLQWRPAKCLSVLRMLLLP